MSNEFQSQLQILVTRITQFASYTVHEVVAGYYAVHRRVRQAIRREREEIDEYLRRKLWETTWSDTKRLRIIELLCDLRYVNHDYAVHGSMELQQEQKMNALMELLFDRNFGHEPESPEGDY